MDSVLEVLLVSMMCIKKDFVYHNNGKMSYYWPLIESMDPAE